MATQTPVPQVPSLPAEPAWFAQLPPWLQVVCATVAAAILLWILVTLLKWTLRFAVVIIIVVGMATAIWLLFNHGAF